MFKNILIPVALDHGTIIGEAIAIARRLQADGGKITLVGVVEQVPGYVAEYVIVHPDEEIKTAIRAKLREVAARQGDLEIAVLAGKPGVAIADMAKTTGADLIVIGSHRPGVQDYFLGSTASWIVRRAPCAVMVLR